MDPSDPGRGSMIMAISWVLTSLCIGFIALRMYVRARITHSTGSDDWLMVLAGILQVAFQACITVGYTHGLGKRDQNLTINQLIEILKWMWISSTPAILTSTVARVSIAVLLMRLFGMHRWLRYFLISFTTLQTICGILIILFVWLQVDPVEGLWNPTIPARRWDPDIQRITAIVGQSLFTFSDLAYVLFPVMIIWRLNMPTHQKLGLITLLGLSIFTMMASVMKTVTSQSNALDPEAQYKASVSVLWSAVEQGLVISLGCVPPLRVLMRLEIPVWKSIRSTLSRFTGSKNSQAGTSTATNTDVELHSRKRDPYSNSLETARASAKEPDTESTRHLTEPGPGAIHRADEYEVSYD
ncbi:uncharacterized protein EI97DRAFT_455140 [Westerdykella ornata]|uniref:Rhodopsin domain-containing protein n=1 Tax=Westerdykella ornata TaxID=318751 RepID=A0A6A6JUD4_WESOR|nr:uncharacterized protein EI97DRAFT_455140 [Westerdykella ornata]KAF2280230.1 hypothetical protein EI97DRAFT_455140 [Westerdykella ornata]